MGLYCGVEVQNYVKAKNHNKANYNFFWQWLVFVQEWAVHQFGWKHGEPCGVFGCKRCPHTVNDCPGCLLNFCGGGEGVLSRYIPFIREGLLLQVKCKIQILYRHCDNSKFIVLYRCPSRYLGQQCFRTVTEVSNKSHDSALQSVFLILRGRGSWAHQMEPPSPIQALGVNSFPNRFINRTVPWGGFAR